MAIANAEGVTPVDLSGYRQRLLARFRERFGEDLDTDPESVAGGIQDIMAASLTELDEVVVEVSNQMSIRHSRGRAIDDQANNLHLERVGATYSTVTATITGVVGTTVEAGARASTDAGAEFELVADALIPAAGTVDVMFQAVNEGAVVAPAGTLTNIVTTVAGWETVTNATDATVGRQVEADEAYRRRYLLSTGRLANGVMDAIVAAVYEAGVTDLRIEENATAAAVNRQGFSLPAHSIMVIAEGGEDADVAAAIARTKGAGVATFAGTGNNAITSDGINFRRVTQTPVKISIETTPNALFPANGVATLRSNMLAYAAGTWAGALGQFEVRGFRIGHAIDARRLQTPLNAVQGHAITAITVTDTADNALPGTPNLDVKYTLATANLLISTS